VKVNNSTSITETKKYLSSELIELKITTTYDVGNSGTGLGQAQKRGGVKPVKGIPTLSS
jgi:hypothetical protein